MTKKIKSLLKIFLQKIGFFSLLLGLILNFCICLLGFYFSLDDLFFNYFKEVILSILLILLGFLFSYLGDKLH